MRREVSFVVLLLIATACHSGIRDHECLAADPPEKNFSIFRPEAFKTLVDPDCSHCIDESRRRAGDLRDDDRVLVWTRGYSEGGAIPYRFFLNVHRVISDSYGVFVYDPDAGFARGFAPSYQFSFHGWRNGVMVMRHQDGTLYSSLSGLAFDGPRKGARLQPIPTLVSDWSFWLNRYPQAVTYAMVPKFQPLELPQEIHEDSRKSRGKIDDRLDPDEPVLGIWTGKSAKAYPLSRLSKSGFAVDVVDGESITFVWEPATRTASAYRSIAHQPRKFQAPQPDANGVSPVDEGTPLPAGSDVLPPRNLTLQPLSNAGRFRVTDKETSSRWDIAGRAVDGELKGWTLTWVDSVQVKWFAWAAEYPDTSIYGE